MDLGIDLGTTNSVLAVEGRVKLAEDYPEGLYLEPCDVTIIPSPEGELTFPTSIWEPPDQPGQLIFGLEAISMADVGESPILFSKRKIGTSEKISLHHLQITSKEAAVHFLRYLKSCAEHALQRKVHRAVVTHPAYFNRNQVEETRQAALEADLDVSLPEQMLMEPIAAALAYTRTDRRDPLRILAYDLGGGTFDVTFLERNGGVLSVRAFDGNHLLGGYNFDRELLHWILDHLAQKKRIVRFDESSMEDQGRLAQMLRLAESVKINLSEQDDDDAPVEIRSNNVLVDIDGRRVSLLERITRGEYLNLIRPLIQETIQACRRTLQKADVTQEEIDYVLLVGGSSKASWIRSALEQEYPNCELNLFHPDLCVAAGAAIHAKMTLSSVIRTDDYSIELSVPKSSVLDVVDVSGLFHSDAIDDFTGYTVVLTSNVGENIPPAPLSNEGSFLFETIPLNLEGATSFQLALYNKDWECMTHSFQVTFDPENTDISTVATVLPKPLFLETLDGLVPLAKEGDFLPALCEQTFIRDNNNENINIRIFQERIPVGNVRIEGIPRVGGRNSKVEVRVNITEKNQVAGSVKIISPEGKLVKDASVIVTFDVPEIPDQDELVDNYFMLRKTIDETYSDIDDPELREIINTRGRELILRIERLFNQQPFEKQEVFESIRELSQLIEQTDDFVPPRWVFFRKVDHCREAVETLVSDARRILDENAAQKREEQGPEKISIDNAVLVKARSTLEKCEKHRTFLNKIEMEGQDAIKNRSRRQWGAVNDALDSIDLQLNERPDLKPPAVVLQLLAAMQVDQSLGRLQKTVQNLSNEDRLSDWLENIQRLQQQIHQIRDEIFKIDSSLPSEKVRSQLALLILQRLEPINKSIQNIGVDLRKV